MIAAVSGVALVLLLGLLPELGAIVVLACATVGVALIAGGYYR